MKRISAIICILVCCISVSCSKHTAKEKYLLERANRQLQVSIEDELRGLNCGAHNHRLEDVKTVFLNDSICVLQFTARFRDFNEEKRVRDYRYVYLLDMLASRNVRHNVYGEQFVNTLCMPDDIIKAVNENNEAMGLSPYNYYFGGTAPVRKPFDAQNK